MFTTSRLATRQIAEPQPEVTTGPLAGSRKVYSSPEGHEDVRVPFREIALTNGDAFQVYDTSGPYTDGDAAIDVKRGLAPLRSALDRGPRRCRGLRRPRR